MKLLIKLLMILPMSTMVSAQLPFFLKHFMPKLSSYSLLSPFASSSLNSPTISNPPPSFGSSGLGSFSMSSPGYGSSSFGSPNYGSSGLSSNILSNFGSSHLSSNIGSSPFGSLNLGSSPFGSLPLPSNSYGAASFPPPNIGASPFSSSSNLGSQVFSPNSFSSSGFNLSPFAAASFNSPTFGPKLTPGSLPPSSVVDFDSVGSFDGGFQSSDLLDDFPGFSHTDFAKDLNFAGSQAVKFRAPIPFNNDFEFRRRSSSKN